MFRFRRLEHKTLAAAKVKTAVTDVKGYGALVVHFYNSG